VRRPTVLGLVPVLALALVAAGCSRERDDSTPEGAVALFLDAIERSENDREALRDAYRLLDAESRRHLADLARTTSALGAREYQPWEMIVEGRAVLSFRPRRGSGLRARPGAGPEDAIVTVTGNDDAQRAEIPVRLEPEGWRVVLALRERPGGVRTGEAGADDAAR
jgi:hypothetical protein